MDRVRHQQKSSSPIPSKTSYDFDDGSSYRSGSRPSSRHDKSQISPPACVTWAQSLHNLLQDPDGVKLFLSYLESEGPQHAEALHFWFACEGLKNHNQAEKIQRLVKLIYKTYFMKSVLQINDDLKKQIMKNLKTPQCLDPPITLFDEAQAQVEHLIHKTTYPNFLKSDMYLQYIQSVENPSSGSDDLSSETSSSSSSVSNKDLGNLASGIGPLPTLHEDMEFCINSQPPLLLTPGTGSVSTGYHTPTPRLTKDMLLRSQKHRALDIRPQSETYAGLIYRSNGAHAAYNSYNPVSRQDSERQSVSSHSDARTESDNLSISDRIVEGRSSGRSRHKSSIEEKQTRQLAAKNRETNMNHIFIPRNQRMDVVDKCRPMDFDEHAALLTQKLENLKREQDSQELFHRRLKESDSMSSLDDKPYTSAQNKDLETAMREKLQFQDDNDQDILDEHVSRVFSDHSLSASPGLASPKPASPPRRWTQPKTRRRDKDVFSTFSGDSGNVHDFPEEPAKVKAQAKAKRALTDLTDSGVSVLSDSVASLPKDSRVMTWLRESDRSSARSGAQSEMAVGGRKHGKKYGSRSNSLERGSGAGPAQPFIADSGMPPLPLPNTDIQLDEIRRRLNEVRSLQRPLNRYCTTRGQKPILPTSEDKKTTVVFSFCDEQFPYRTKIPGSQITLKQFKDYLPKKGNYRFFFKTVCEDLSNQVTHEEVNNDGEVLPLWEGKIMAQVKPID